MEEITSKYMSDSDSSDFERIFKDTLVDLESKRVLLDEQTKELVSLRTEKLELQQEVEKIQHEKKYLQKQLDGLNKISRQREEEWSRFREDWAQNKIKFEIFNKSSNALKQQISNLQEEVSKLKVHNEELEREVHKNSVWKEKCLIIQTRTEITMETLNRQVHNLEQDHIKLDHLTRTMVRIANRTQLFRKHLENLLMIKTEENATLNHKTIELSAKLEQLKSLKKEKSSEESITPENFINSIDDWKACQKEMHESALQNFDKIKEVYESMEKLQMVEMETAKTIRDLEQALQEERERFLKSKVSDFECQVNTFDEKKTPEELIENEK